MGYTIYWQQRECTVGIWRTAVHGVKAILEAAAARGIQCDVIELSSSGNILFAGPVGETYENFLVGFCGSSDQGTLAFCKTMQRAYDPVVRAVLMYLCDLGIVWNINTDAGVEVLEQSHVQLAQELLVAAGVRRVTRSAYDT
jgi:hypothetical protein